MHNLIQVIGREIVHEEIVQLGRHCRLWDASFIQLLLEDEETKSPLDSESNGVEDIEAIFLEISNLNFFVKSTAFKSCSELKSIQDFPRNLKELYLAGTAIKEVPSSLCDLTDLVVLDVGNCKRLQNLPIGMDLGIDLLEKGLASVAHMAREDHQKLMKAPVFSFSVPTSIGAAEGSDPDILDDVVVFEFLPVNGHSMFLDDCCMVTRCRVDVIAVATKKTILNSRQPTTYVREELDAKGMEKISFNEVNVMESREVGVIHVEKKNFEELEKRRWESISMRIIPREKCLKQLGDKLDMECNDKETRIVGIIGMVGIGKPYLAIELYQKLKMKFGQSVFIDFAREKSKEHGLDWLEKKLVEGLLKRDYGDLGCDDGNAIEVWKHHLIQKKALDVFDNVSDQKQIKSLMGNGEWIKKGSKIVITTEDKSLLNGLICDLYEVPGLNDREGLALFSSHAFESPICGILKGKFMELSRKFVDYAGGNPLALKAFGAELCGKDKGCWEARLKTLTTRSNSKIMKKLRISYDELNELQKDAFLDILCFFRSQDENYIRSLLDSFDPESREAGREIRDLADKFFIRVFDGRVEMHNLLYTLGSELVETTAGKSRLLLSKDAELADLQRKNKERDRVRGIVLDMSKMEETQLENQAFVDMSSLRYLKVYDPGHSECKLNIPDGIEFPKENIVRYLDWMKFPRKKIPSHFEPANLIDLRLPFSKITSIWNCAKVTPKLKWVDLSHSIRSPVALHMPTGQMHSTFIFTNCHELEQVSKNAITSYVQKKSEFMSDDRYNQDFVFKSLISTCFPGCDVPEWFSHQAFVSVLKMELPRDFSQGRLNGIALCVVVSFKEYKDQNNSLQVKCTWELTNESMSVESFVVGGWSNSEDEPHTVESDHTFIGYHTLPNTKKRQQFSSATEVSLRFVVTNGTSEVAVCKVMKCGFSLVYESDEAEITSWEANPSMQTNRQGKISSYGQDVVDCPIETPTTSEYNKADSFLKFFRIKSKTRDVVIPNEGENLGHEPSRSAT
ncbi:hypothetical protein AALP_AAs46094U000400 [Arabis alpina]|uniref:ADP-ribosyl cyclase/cyclic ADP-ribose hydrolase n=1 Tax=Arabis alpina TaxID=50452 RepID=A0A087G2F9_ARAAL|nr:hypothetical protein AALP_AAs46094U000400 [Arabis alpina]